MAGMNTNNIRSTRTRSGAQNAYNDQLFFLTIGGFEPRYEKVGINTTMIKTRIYRGQRILPMDSIVEPDAGNTITDAIVIPNDLDEQLPEVNYFIIYYIITADLSQELIHIIYLNIVLDLA